jgi:OmpA-OmpF porin, OOP family
MGIRVKLVLAAVSSSLLASTALAGFERDGWYVGIEGGWVSVNDTDFNGGADIAFDGGLAALATLGYALKNSDWRFEGEVGYRDNDVKDFGGRVATEGNLTEYTYMINAVYDLKIKSERWGLAFGAGIGIDNPHFDATDGTESSDVVFAAQGIAGVTYRAGQHWDLALNYRYLWVNEAELQQSIQFPERDVDLGKHTITLGLRYGYDEPPAVIIPPPQPPAPPIAKQFIIFFGFNKCNITAEADAVLSEAAAAARAGNSASVRIVGHTDTVGSNSYNQKLSECRANAAKSNLVGKGVSDGAISTSGKGESELMVQTGDGVKEPQNRRATVDLN